MSRVVWVVVLLFAVMVVPSEARPTVVHLNDGLENALFSAAATGNLGKVSAIVGRGAAVNVRDQNGDTPLHWAVGHGHYAVAEFLIAHGADVHARDRAGETPLFGADGKRVAELLIAHGATVDSRDFVGQTPLDKAAWRGRLGVMRVLIAHGANVNARDHHGFMPLDNAAWSGGDRVAAEALLRSHGAVESRVPGMILPARRAAQKGQ